MTTWSRVNLPGPAGTYFVAGLLRAAVNSYGLIELFASDINGMIWHAAQSLRPFGMGLGPSGRPIYRTVWGLPGQPLWVPLGLPAPAPAPGGYSLPTFTPVAVAQNSDGRLELFTIGFDSN